MKGSACFQGTSLTMEDALELGRAMALLGATPAALRKFEAVRYCCSAKLRNVSYSVDGYKTAA